MPESTTLESVAKWLVAKKTIGHITIAVDDKGFLNVLIRVRHPSKKNRQGQ